MQKRKNRASKVMMVAIWYIYRIKHSRRCFNIIRRSNDERDNKVDNTISISYFIFIVYYSKYSNILINQHLLILYLYCGIINIYC